MKKSVLEISGMECPNCAMKLEQLEDQLQGVLFVEASYHKAQMIVEYAEDEISEEKIKDEVKNLGYLVVASHPVKK